MRLKKIFLFSFFNNKIKCHRNFKIFDPVRFYSPEHDKFFNGYVIEISPDGNIVITSADRSYYNGSSASIEPKYVQPGI